jgi:hypothetical protein
MIKKLFEKQKNSEKSIIKKKEKKNKNYEKEIGIQVLELNLGVGYAKHKNSTYSFLIKLKTINFDSLSFEEMQDLEFRLNSFYQNYELKISTMSKKIDLSTNKKNLNERLKNEKLKINRELLIDQLETLEIAENVEEEFTFLQIFVSDINDLNSLVQVIYNTFPDSEFLRKEEVIEYFNSITNI